MSSLIEERGYVYHPDPKLESWYIKFLSISKQFKGPTWSYTIYKYTYDPRSKNKYLKIKLNPKWSWTLADCHKHERNYIQSKNIKSPSGGSK